MMINLYVISFVSIFLLTFAFIHVFIFHVLNMGFYFSNKIKKISILLLSFLFFSFVIGEITNRFFNQTIFYYIGSIWAGIISISFSVFFFTFLFMRIIKKHFKYVVIISITIILIISSISLVKGLKFPEVKNISLNYKNINNNINGLTIVQLTDLHLGGFQSKKWKKELINKVNSFNPDIIALTGDIMDRDLCEKDNECYLFKNLKSKLGVYAVSGNHEFYEGYNKFLKYMKRNNIKVLKNEVIKINEYIEIGGIEDFEYTKYIKKLFKKKIFNISLTQTILL